MHVIERTERFTLIGADARRGKLTLFEAEGPRERGRARADRAARLVPGRARARRRPRRRPRGRARRGRDGRRVRPRPHRAHLLGSRRRRGGLGGVRVRARRRDDPGSAAERSSSCSPATRGRPSGRSSTTSASSSTRSRSTSPAPRSAASRSTTSSTRRTPWPLFVWGPDRVKLEYVEHKPSFSLS